MSLLLSLYRVRKAIAKKTPKNRVFSNDSPIQFFFIGFVWEVRFRILQKFFPTSDLRNGKVITLIASIVFTAACGGGFAFLTTETRPEKQWVPAGFGTLFFTSWGGVVMKSWWAGWVWSFFFVSNLKKRKSRFRFWGCKLDLPKKAWVFRSSQSKNPSNNQKKSKSQISFPKNLGNFSVFFGFGIEFYLGIHFCSNPSL